MKLSKDNRLSLLLPKEVYQLRRDLQDLYGIHLNRLFNLFLVDENVSYDEPPKEYMHMPKTKTIMRVYKKNLDYVPSYPNRKVAYNFYLYLKKLIEDKQRCSAI